MVDMVDPTPSFSGPHRTALKDLALSVGWHDLRSIHVPESQWTLIIGHKRRSDPLRAVLPLPLHTTSLHPSSLRLIFTYLHALTYAALPPADPPLAPEMDDLRSELDRRRERRRRERESKTTPPEEVNGENGEKTLDESEVGGDEAAVENGVEGNPDDGLNTELDREMIYMAICTSDSTVVYYKLARGIKKPADIPDE